MPNREKTVMARVSQKRNHPLPPQRPLSAILLAGTLSLAGCAGSHGGMARDVQKPAHDTDIFKVVCSYHPAKMWKSFDTDGDPNPEGFVFVMHLLSKETGRGKFAEGTFRAKIYRVEHVGERLIRTLVLELPADMADVPQRSETMAGFGYQPQLYWGDLDIYGQEIDIVIQYESPTGRVVQSQTHTTRVPQRKM